MLSDSPPERDINWSIRYKGGLKFKQKIWSQITKNQNVLVHTLKRPPTKLTQNAIKFRGQIYSYLSDVSNNIELFQMNVAVAKIYEWLFN